MSVEPQLDVYIRPRRHAGPEFWIDSEPLTYWVRLDASISETHTSSAQLSRHPRERAADVTDHVHQEPDEVTITGLFSNTPSFTRDERPTADGWAPPDPDRAFDMYEDLRGLKERGTEVTVVTGLRRYTNMIIESLAVNRQSARALNEVEVEIRLTKALTVEPLLGEFDVSILDAALGTHQRPSPPLKKSQADSPVVGETDASAAVTLGDTLTSGPEADLGTQAQGQALGNVTGLGDFSSVAGGAQSGGGL